MRGGARARNNVVTDAYLLGIAEGRETFEREGLAFAADHLANLRETARRFGADSPVGQALRGERDFWALKVKRAARGAE